MPLVVTYWVQGQMFIGERAFGQVQLFGFHEYADANLYAACQVEPSESVWIVPGTGMELQADENETVILLT